MNRIYHPYWKWEDAKNGMYDNRIMDEKTEEIMAYRAKALLSNPSELEAGCYEVIEKWPYACEHNLTNFNMNRNAWLGQAVCSLKLNCTERITKYGYNLMDLEDQAKANAIAERIIKLWSSRNEDLH